MRRQHVLLGVGLAVLLSATHSSGNAQSQQRTPLNSVEQNKALVRRWIEQGFNKTELSVVDELFAEDFVVNGQKIGRQGLKQGMTGRLTAFPDLHVTITEILAEGDKVGLWYTVQATQKGNFEGISATGKQVNWSGADLLRVAGGKIVEAQFVDDSLGLLRQLGATVSPPPIR